MHCKDQGYYDNGNYQNCLFGNYGNVPNCGNLTQIQSNKKQQALRYSYETLGNLLSSAENFAGEQNQKYRKFNISTSNNYEDLKSEFAWELHCFQLAIKKFQQKFQCQYIFPQDLEIETVKKDINRYMKKIQNKKDLFLYELMLKLMNLEDININFDNLFEELDKNANSKINPEKLRKIIAPLNEILNKNIEEADKGNMNLELLDENNNKNREALREIFKNSKALNFKRGIEGDLKSNQDSLFEFNPYKSTNSKKIKIDNPSFDKYRCLDPSLYSYNKHEGLIYIIKKNDKNVYHSVDFCEKGKNFNKDLFKEIAYFPNYIVGTININQNEYFYALLKYSEEFK